MRFLFSAEAMAQNPARAFGLFLLLHVLVWTLLPTLVCPNAPLDVIENYVWGQAWVLGTHKHPPMQAWLLEGLSFVTGRNAFTAFLASQIAIGVGFWAVWQTARRMVGEAKGLLAVLLLEAVAYYNFTSPEFNANVLQIPFWALMGWSFYRAVTEDRKIDWCLLGVWSAGGMYSKYSTLLFLGVLGLALVIDPVARKRLRGAGPYLALIVGAVLFAPHFYWLITHDFLPLTYSADRMGVHGAGRQAQAAFRFLGSQLLILAPLALLYFTCTKKDVDLHPISSRTDALFLKAVVAGPFLTVFLMLLLTGFQAKDMWATPFWNFAGLALLFFFPRRIEKRMGKGIVFVVLAFLIGFAGNVVIGPYVSAILQRVHFPGREMSTTMTQAWHENFGTALPYVIGDVWLAGNVATYAPERPPVFLDNSPIESPWIDAADLKNRGAIFLWCRSGCSQGAHEEPPEAIKNYPAAQMQPTLVLKRQTAARTPDIRIGWAFIPPA